MVSCKPTRQIQTAIAKKDTVQAATNTAHLDSMAFIDRTLGRIDSNRIGFNTFTAKVNVDYRGADDKNYDVNANLRMYRDSAIWVSVNAILGIEALRLLITKDSVKILPAGGNGTPAEPGYPAGPLCRQPGVPRFQRGVVQPLR
jgi:hypothetical protein